MFGQTHSRQHLTGAAREPNQIECLSKCRQRKSNTIHITHTHTALDAAETNKLTRADSVLVFNSIANDWMVTIHGLCAFFLPMNSRAIGSKWNTTEEVATTILVN